LQNKCSIPVICVNSLCPKAKYGLCRPTYIKWNR